VYRELIEFTEDDSEEVWKGYMYAFLLFAESVVNSCFYQQMFHIGMTTGMKIKAAVIAMVYRKVRNTSSNSSSILLHVNARHCRPSAVQYATRFLAMIILLSIGSKLDMLIL